MTPGRADRTARGGGAPAQDPWVVVAVARAQRGAVVAGWVRTAVAFTPRSIDIILEKGLTMGAIASALYGLVAYFIFFGTFLYAIAFVGNFPVPKTPVPKTIDSGDAGPVMAAVAIDLLLLGLFGLQHSVMARPGFKRWWTRFVPKPIERATYVLLASLALALVFWQWRPIPAPVWAIANPAAAAAVQAVAWLGWATVLLSSFLLDHLELFGLRQAFARLVSRTLPDPTFRTPFLYKLVRHPIYLGFLLAFWAAPSMTAGHLLFAAATTGYILIGIRLEERDLVDTFGGSYCVYRQQVPMLVPLPGRRQAGCPARTEP